MNLSTIRSTNDLPKEEKREIYARLIPPELHERFQIPSNFIDSNGNDLLFIDGRPGSSTLVIELFHEAGFRDPLVYGHITDTVNGQLHVLLYVMSDPYSPRFDVDCLQDGTRTIFGTKYRNLEAEESALKFGLAPGQIRDGLSLLGSAMRTFELFVESLGHNLYFIEPLYYHNAIIFERYGFLYEKGRRLMERIQDGFSPGGVLIEALDNSSPFRTPESAQSIRLRSWSIHDNILGEPFNDVTMYKKVHKQADLNTSVDCPW
jgi:hypothetical protein